MHDDLLAVEDKAIREAVAFLRDRSVGPASVAIVAGSGLSALADQLERSVVIGYDNIPHWPAATVSGHAGSLAFGALSGAATLVAAGRVHLYEGHGPRRLVFGIRVMHALGASTLIVTNAAGGLAADLAPGSVLVLADHIFLPGLVGWSPLRGPNDESAGPRFPSMVDAYDPALRIAAGRALSDSGLAHREGVYAMAAGPAYETPAEARMLRGFGADAVGMSTAPEVVVARHLGMRVLGLSLITNRVFMGEDVRPPDDRAEEEHGGHAVDGAALHAEVTRAGAAAAPRMAQAIAAVVGGIAVGP